MGCTSSSSRGRLGSDKAQFTGLPQQFQLPADGANGAMQTSEKMSILLIFPRGDQLGERFCDAARRLSAACDTAHCAEEALELYIGEQHDLLLMDRRRVGDAATEFDADSLIRSLRAITHSSFSTFVAVTGDSEMDEDALGSLLQLGFDKRFKAAQAADASCYEELLSAQRTCFRFQQRLSSLTAVFTALDHCGDAVEITDDRFRIQYVNAAHERFLGYSSGELIGKNSFDATKVEKNEEDVKNLSKFLRRGREWDGTARCRRKSGANADHHDFYYPVRDRRGRVHQFVCLKRPLLSEKQQQQQQQQHHSNSHRHSSGASKDAAAAAAAAAHRHALRPAVSDSRKASIHSICSAPPLDGTGAKGPLAAAIIRGSARKDSANARASSVAAEAPIHKVISLINAAQDSCSPAAAGTLGKVLDILHQFRDLYGSEVPSAAEDTMASDYVGGLMTGGTTPADKKRQPGLQHRQNSSANMQSLTEIPEQIVAFLDGEDEWSFDILELERVTQQQPMVYLAMKTLRRFNVCQFLQCGEDTMLKWLQVMQDHYHADNCYHNATHGADVMQSSAYFLERDRIKSVFDDMDEVASLLGALVHDLDHPGRTNPFLINSQHRLALLYNDISVLESHHASLAFQLTTRDDRIDIFKNMSREDYKTLRQSMVDIVLATEMAKHFEHVGKFSNQIVAPLVAKEDEDGAAGITEEEALEMLTKAENRVLIKRVLIKCSDVSNPCRSLKLCKEWARRISEEYFQQTDEEKSSGLPIVMPVFDRSSCNMPHSQTSFIDFFLREMFTAWHAFCDVPELLENLNNNYAYWKQLADQNKRAEEAMREEEAPAS